MTFIRRLVGAIYQMHCHGWLYMRTFLSAMQRHRLGILRISVLAASL